MQYPVNKSTKKKKSDDNIRQIFICSPHKIEASSYEFWKFGKNFG